jgi:hypothetical protein
VLVFTTVLNTNIWLNIRATPECRFLKQLKLHERGPNLPWLYIHLIREANAHQLS